MDWKTALERLPYRLAVTDRKGRVLLLSGPIPGVQVGRSFLKLASKEEVVVVGRAAKRALSDGTERHLPSVETCEGERASVTLTPFSLEGDTTEHLLVTVDEPEGRPRSLAPSKPLVPAAAPPRPAPKTTPGGLPPVPPASELVIVASGGILPIARALEGVMNERVKTRAWPVSRLVDALSTRGGSESESIDAALDPTTRVLFIGDSPYAAQVRAKAIIENATPSGSGWAIGGQRVRAAAVWNGDPPPGDASDLISDLQFEMMEVVRKAMPMRRSKVVDVAPSLKSAAEFLEQPSCMDMTGDLVTQARHHMLVMAVARFVQTGMNDLIDSPDR